MTDTKKVAEIAAEAFMKEARFRMLAQSCVGFAMSERGPVDPERADADAYDIAILATATLLQRIYEDDAELNALRAQNAYLEKLVKELNLTAAPQILPRSHITGE